MRRILRQGRMTQNGPNGVPEESVLELIGLDLSVPGRHCSGTFFMYLCPHYLEPFLIDSCFRDEFSIRIPDDLRQ